MKKDRGNQIVYSGMVVRGASDGVMLGESLPITAKLEGTRGQKISTTLQLRNVQDATLGRIHYVYTGTTEVNGQKWSVTANLYRVADKVVYGFIEAAPPKP